MRSDVFVKYVLNNEAQAAAVFRIFWPLICPWPYPVRRDDYDSEICLSFATKPNFIARRVCANRRKLYRSYSTSLLSIAGE